MKDSQVFEAELLVELRRAEAAYRDASDYCKERGQGRVAECMEPAARDYRNALRSFSDLILDGKTPSGYRLSLYDTPRD
jgi:hypothetical protein